MLRLADVIRRHGLFGLHGASWRLHVAQPRARREVHPALPHTGEGRPSRGVPAVRHRAPALLLVPPPRPVRGADTTRHHALAGGSARQLLPACPLLPGVVFTLPRGAAAARALPPMAALLPVLFRAAFTSARGPVRRPPLPRRPDRGPRRAPHLDAYPRVAPSRPHAGPRRRRRPRWPHVDPRATPPYALPGPREGPRQALPRALPPPGAARPSPGVAFPPIPWGKPWIVFAKPVVQGVEKVLEYLGRYVHKTALSDHAIVASDDRTVTFRYRDSRDQRTKTMTTLPADELSAPLPPARPPPGNCTGSAPSVFSHHAHRDTLRRLQLLLAPRQGSEAPTPEQPPRLRLPCPRCGQASLVLLRRLSADECAERANAAALGHLGLPSARAPP